MFPYSINLFFCRYQFMLKLLEQLVQIPSPTGQEYAIGQFLTHYLDQKGFHVIQQSVGEKRYNLLATTSSNPHILFCTHLDVVPPHIPFHKEGNRIFGRGACDAKGQIAAIVAAGDRLLAEHIDGFGFLFVVGEEKDSDGAKKAAALKTSSRYVVICEPTDNKLVTGQKGTLVFKISARGSGGHSCSPENKTSAIHQLLACLYDWQDVDWGADPVLGRSTVNIGTITGGTGINIIAETATAEGIFRVASSVQYIKEKLQQLVPTGIELEIRSESDPQKLLSLPGFDTAVVAFGTDASYLRPLGEIALLGPGSITVAHSADEHISITELNKAVELLVKIAKQLI